MLASSGDRPSEKPSEMPIAAPTRSPGSDSSSVVARCTHSEPLTTHWMMRPAMSDGRLTKKASSTFSETSVCQTAIPVTPIASCQNSAAGWTALRAGTRHRPLTLDDFLAEHGPDRAIQIEERGRRPQFHEVARTVERDRVLRDDPRRGPRG